MSDIDRLFDERWKALEQKNRQANEVREQAQDDAETERKRFAEDVKPFFKRIDAFLTESGAAIEGKRGRFEREQTRPTLVSVVREVSLSVALVPKTPAREMIPSFGFAVEVGEDRNCIVAVFERCFPGGYRKEIFEGSESIDLGRFDGDEVFPQIQEHFFNLLNHAWDKTEHLL